MCHTWQLFESMQVTCLYVLEPIPVTHMCLFELIASDLPVFESMHVSYMWLFVSMQLTYCVCWS